MDRLKPLQDKNWIRPYDDFSGKELLKTTVYKLYAMETSLIRALRVSAYLYDT